MPLFTRGVKTLSKTSSPKLKGDVTLSPGANISLTQVGQDIEIEASVDEPDVISLGLSGFPLQGIITISDSGILTITQLGQNINFDVTESPDVSSLAKQGDTPLTGAVTLSAGSNISLNQVGQNIQIAASVPPSGVTGFSKFGSSVLTGNVTISPGNNITLTQFGQDVAIIASTDPSVLSDISDLQSDVSTLQTDVGNLQTEVADIQGAVGSASSASVSPTTLDSGNTSLTSNVATLILNNPSASRSMGVQYTVVARIYGNTDNAFTDRLQMAFDLQTNVNGGGYTTPVNLNEYIYMDSDGTQAKDLQRVWTGTATVAPSAGFTIDARMVLTWSGVGAAAYIVDNCLVEISAIGVPL